MRRAVVSLFPTSRLLAGPGGFPFHVSILGEISEKIGHRRKMCRNHIKYHLSTNRTSTPIIAVLCATFRRCRCRRRPPVLHLWVRACVRARARPIDYFVCTGSRVRQANYDSFTIMYARARAHPPRCIQSHGLPYIFFIVFGRFAWLCFIAMTCVSWATFFSFAHFAPFLGIYQSMGHHNKAIYAVSGHQSHTYCVFIIIKIAFVRAGMHCNFVVFVCFFPALYRLRCSAY